MPSSNEGWARRTIVAFAACTFAAMVVPAAEPAKSGTTPTPPEVRSAVEALRADPNLMPERKTRTLRWKNSEDQRPRRPSGWVQWLLEAFRWLAGSARMLVWGVISLLVAMLVVAVVRQLRFVEMRANPRRTDAPTHVRDLDIRPESLPDDIGTAALALWEQGEQRAALSLLYRGLLSRLVHAHRVPIRQSSTEGDCLLLAEQHLRQDKVAYASRLVRTWQRAVYGGREAEPAEVRGLCADFGTAMAGVEAGESS